eukprot:GAFH01002155.1.p2 GENE.GAFH01002155.1~~GAFH01002155.1.p2  ORF type:complete len:395 (+),score=146.09 GAFH01002155.1:63-1187(+)
MAGGASSRFYPMNKIFADPTGCGRTMVQQAFDRVCSPSAANVYSPSSFVTPAHFSGLTLPPAMSPSQFFVVTGHAEVGPMREQLSALPSENVLDEPERRNTLPAILWAIASMMRAPASPAKDLCVAIVTADHLIGNAALFRSTLYAARERATREPVICTIGIQPSALAREWTGFGAINADQAHPLAPLDGTRPEYPVVGHLPALPLVRFEEKPSESRAGQMIAQGGWYWNAGMFVFRVSTLELALKAFQPAMHGLYLDMCRALGAANQPEARRLFGQLPKHIPHPLEPAKMADCSIDYALMVPMSMAQGPAPVRGVVLPGVFPWLDIGSWDALRKVLTPDGQANVVVGPVTLDGATRDSILVVEAPLPGRPRPT